MNYHRCRNKRKRYIERRLVALILGKTTKIGNYSVSGSRYIENVHGTELRINIYWGCIKFFIFDKQGGLIGVDLKTLPKKIALLLAIIHRPLFEAYKKYLENNDIPQEKAK